jgi:effector-binding domain-containing protein
MVALPSAICLEQAIAKKGSRTMSYQCELLNRSAQPTLAIRTRAAVRNLPQVVGQAYGAIMQYAGLLGVQPSGAPFVAYHNMDMQDMDIEIGFPFAQELAGHANIQAGEIPGGKAVACMHIGPYDQVGGAYEALQRWIGANNFVPAGVAYEFYLNDPQITPPSELQTQVVFPLK